MTQTASINTPERSGPIRVVVVDDSALMRKIIPEILNAASDITVVGTAADPYAARAIIKELNPDVVTLDIEMPRMDGIAFLEKIMALRPMPVVMISSLTQVGAEATLRALEVGAIDFIPKPKLDLSAGLQALSEEMISKVRAAARVKVAARPRRKSAKPTTEQLQFSGRGSEVLVAVGASTGGVEALSTLISPLPPNGPAMVVVQHMPAQFTASFASRLNTMSAAEVAEARDGERLLPGHVYIAPGNRHTSIHRSGANFICRLTDEPLVSGHRPSADVLFNSVAKSAGANAIGVILTGMGKDGAAGLQQMRNAGAYTIGQNERSCLVYGMPKAAFDMGAVTAELDLREISQEVLKICNQRASMRV